MSEETESGILSDHTTQRIVSVVVPFHNEEDNITELYARLAV